MGFGIILIVIGLFFLLISKTFAEVVAFERFNESTLKLLRIALVFLD